MVFIDNMYESHNTSSRKIRVACFGHGSVGDKAFHVESYKLLAHLSRASQQTECQIFYSFFQEFILKT